MKKFLIIAITFVLMLGCVSMSACAKSNAVTRDELIRENFAAEKEAEDDAKGREHIEIPENAETIEIDEEEWIVLRSIEEFEERIFYSNDGGLEKNYILANDIDLKRHQTEADWLEDYVFSGKLNGNNFKFYSSEETGGFGACLFYVIENAVIENVVFSSSDGYYYGSSAISATKNRENVLISAFARNSLIKNCINYFQVKNLKTGFGGFVNYSFNSIIENCVNYADFATSNGGIVGIIEKSSVINCKNYGNLVSYNSDNGIGGIVTSIYSDCNVEGCINYGKIVGTMGVGGIVGGAVDNRFNYISVEYKNFTYAFININEENYTDNQIVSNCKNYGDIYVLKEDGTSRLENISRNVSALNNTAMLFGGIAGAVSKVENSQNYGNFYGLESLGKNITVNYIGGVVGAAKQVVNCINTGTMVIQKGKADNVGDTYGFLIGN